MLRFVEMLPCMLMRGGIATADVTAGETQAQMHPARADSQAILAAFGARRYIANHFQMRVSHVLSSSNRRSIVESAIRSIQWIRSTILPSMCPAAKPPCAFAASGVLRGDRNLELRRFDGAVQPLELAVFSRAALATRLF
jgi:hypothetical protein